MIDGAVVLTGMLHFLLLGAIAVAVATMNDPINIAGMVYLIVLDIVSMTLAWKWW